MSVHPRAENLSGVDAAWLRMEKPDNLMTIMSVLGFDDPIDYDTLCDKIAHELVVPFVRFRQRVVHRNGVLLRPRWELDPAFDLSRHIRKLDLPRPTDDALRELLDRLASTPLDPHRPLWEVLLVQNAPRGNMLVSRIHHSLADGFALVYLTLSLVDEGCEIELPSGLRIAKPNIREAPPQYRGRVDRFRRTTARFLHSGLDLARHAPSPFAVGRRVMSFAASTHRMLTLPPDTPASLKGPLQGGKRVAWTRPLSLSNIKSLGRSVGATINDILLLALSGALRRLLQHERTRLDGLELRCTIPVNLRPLETRDASLGNGFGLVFLELPVGIAAASERLAALKSRMDALKGSAEPVVSYLALGAAGLTPSRVQDALVGIFHDKSTLVVTNVPGPSKPLQFAGKPISSLTFFVPQSAGAGIGVSFFSHAGSVHVGILADTALLPDPTALAQAIEAEVDDLPAALA